MENKSHFIKKKLKIIKLIILVDDITKKHIGLLLFLD